MKLSNEVVEKICGMDHLSGKERTERLAACEKVAAQVSRAQTVIARTEEEHKSNMNNLVMDLDAIRGTCPHEFKKYYPDASGGSDSFSECQVCGAEV